MSEIQFRTDSHIPAENALLDCFDLFRLRARTITTPLKRSGIKTFGDLVRSRSKLSDVLDSANLGLVADFLEDRGYPVLTA